MEMPEANNLSNEDINNIINEMFGTTQENTNNQSSNQTDNTEPIEEQRENIRVPDIIETETHNRFSGAEWFSEIPFYQAAIIGCGGIGSWTSLLIARCGMNVTLLDSDRVEPTNLSGQLFGKRDFGYPKVNALNNIVREYTDSYVTPFVSIYNNELPSYIKTIIASKPILICGLDNMQSRNYVFQDWLNTCKESNFTEKKLFIDGRLSADTLQIYCITNNNQHSIEQYKKSLFTDSEADATVCSFKQTSYMAAMIGSLITNIIINYIASNKSTNRFYDVPYYIEYNSNTMRLKIE